MNQETHDRSEGGWSDEMLERLIDGEVTDEVAAALRDELRRSPEARRELAEIRRTDEIASDVLGGIIDGRMDAVSEAMDRHQRRAATRMLASVACVALLVGGAFVLGRYANGTPQGVPSDSRLVDAGPRETIDAMPANAVDPKVPDDRRAVRTVFEMPVRGKRATALAESEPDAATDGLASSGDDSAASDAPSDRERERRVLALGRTLRSADLARQTLDAMPSGDQLEACRIWARVPSLRPVAFERLARLQSDPALAGECARIASEMSEDRALLAWARSHNLRTTAPTHQ
jgi:hypothetical protein